MAGNSDMNHMTLNFVDFSKTVVVSCLMFLKYLCMKVLMLNMSHSIYLFILSL